MHQEPLPPGVHVALATPLTSDFEIDVAGARRLVEHVIEGGIHGLIVLGSTGELPSIPAAKRRKMVQTVLEATAGRVPVITALAQNSFEDAVEEVQALAGQGVRGVLATVPFYYPTNQAGIENFYRRLAERSPLPLLIYNIPQFTKLSVPPQTVASLARDGMVRGIKDSSGDFEYFSQVVFATRGIAGFRVFTGSDTMLFASLAIGADGTIAGGPNLAPKLAVDLYAAYEAADWTAARSLQEKVLRLVMATRRGIFPAAIKAGLEMLGICEAVTAPPVPPLSAEDREQLRVTLAELGLLPLRGMAA